MKAIDLYKLEPQRIERCLGHLKGYYYDHLPEISEKRYIDSYYGLEDVNEKIDIKYYADYSFDGRRTWTLASVWYENDPVMIIQNAGREGDDHRVRYITNEQSFKKMISYIESLLTVEDNECADLINDNDDIETLDRFYGFSLHDLYNPDLQPEYKVGDIVEAHVAVKQYGFVLDDTPMIKKKVEILSVNSTNPHDTYRVMEIERHITGSFDWKTKTDTRKTEEVSNEKYENKIYCRLNSNLVQIEC